jgi:Zn-dependent protease with chaperone function
MRPAAARGATPFEWSAALLGALGLTSSTFVVVQLLESWRVSRHAGSHRISILGQMLSYPAANFAALVVLLLGLLGLTVMVVALVGSARELAAAARLRRLITSVRARPLGPDDRTLVVEDAQPWAFCAGLLRPRIYVSSGAVETLDEIALNAVLLHERHHVRRRDPLRLALGGVLTRALFFLPNLRQLVRRQQELAELSADEAAIRAAAENRSALARAMLLFADASDAGAATGIEPARVDQLFGAAPSWQFPSLLFVCALLVLALVAAIALLAGRVAVGSATLDPPFLSRQPCVVVLAMIPCALAAVGLRVARCGKR